MTRGKTLLFMILIGFPSFLSVAYGNSEQAQKELYRSYFRFMNELESSRNYSKSHISELKSKIITPAENALLDTRQEELRAKLKNQQIDFKKKRPSTKVSAHTSPRSSSGSSHKQKTPVFQPSTEKEPEVIIDGSNVPKEIEFSGKKHP